MKKYILALMFAACTIFSANAQYVTIPDSNFAQFISINYGAISNFNQLDTTNANVVNVSVIDCQLKGIKNLEGIQYFDNLHSLDCNRNLLTGFPSLPPSLETLVCYGNALTDTTRFPNTLKHLRCENNNLHTLPLLPDSLRELYCGDNPITSLLSLPTNLQFLSAYNCNLSGLPNLPQSLRSLNVGSNHISNFPAFPDSLDNLGIANNNLPALPLLNIFLTSLDASNNNITSINSLPQYLTYLNVSNNWLPALPDLYLYDELGDNHLSWLNCSNNYLTSLPVLKYPLMTLNASGNQIVNLPYIPGTVKDIDISNNLISSFPNYLPPNLQTLICHGNTIDIIPVLPNSLRYLRCGSSSLITITNLPPNLYEFSCLNSPNIHCLPYIGNIEHMTLENTGITCLPNYGSITQSFPPNINSVYPLCTPDFNLSCPLYANVAGRVYTDDNQNCIMNNTEVGQANVRQELWSNGTLQQVMYTGATGHYSFNTDTVGNYIIVTDTSNIVFESACPANGILYDTITLNDSIHLNWDFALHCRPGFNLVAQSIIAPDIFRPANFSVVNIHAGDYANFYGANCAIGVSGTVTVNITGPASYISPANGALTPGNVSGNTISWNIADFGSVNFNTSFGLIVQTDTFAQSGQQVCFHLQVTPTTGDNDTTNNALTHCFEVVNSYDPNDKQVSPPGNIDTAQEWLTYTVRFQNTGTAEAQHIFVMDTLNSHLDATSFQLLAYSHQPNVQLNENIIRFNFSSINLPDSNTNEPGSHGYVQYKVKLKQDLPIGTVINNTAYIYFDFNDPVVTNTTANTIVEEVETGISTANKELVLSIYPNPANQQITVAGGQAGSNINIYNTQGKLLNTYIMNGEAHTIDIAALSSGIYYIEVVAKEVVARRKLVKL